MSPSLKRLRIWRALVYGLMATIGLIGLVTLVWAAVPSGSSVLYTSSDTVLMPVGTTFTGQTLGVLGPFVASGSMALAGALTPPQLTANQDNYNPTGLATANLLRLSTDAPRDLTGLTGGTLGRILTLHNVGTQNLNIRSESTASAAANRLAMPSDLVLPANGMIVIQYDVTSTRWRTIAPQLTGGTLNGALLTLQQQAGDGSPAPAGTVVVYAKTDGNVFARDPAGNVKDLVNAGGTGPGTGVGLTAKFITLTNMDRQGEETIEGITTSSSRVFVAGQTNPTENGIYNSQPGTTQWTRTSDALAGSTFASGTLVTITDGIAGATGNKGTTWMYTSAGTYNTSALTSIKTAYGPSAAAFEQIVNKGAVNGYPSLGPDSMLTWTQSGSRATHGAVAAAGTITPTATTMGVSGSGGAVIMTSANPRIAGCTTTAHHGRKLTLKGSDATFTLTMPNGQGVRLCGNTGSVVFGLNQQAADFVCDGNVPEWQQINCGDLQQAKNVNGTILGATDLASAVKVCDTAGGNCLNLYGSTIQGTQGGAGIDHVVNVPSGKSLIIQGAGVEMERTTAAGVHTYSGAGKPVKTVYVPAGSFETDQSVCSDPVRGLINGSPKQVISCTDPVSDTPALYWDMMMPLSWDAATISIVVGWFSGSNLSGQHIDTDWNGFCVRDNDAVPTHTTSGVQSALITFGAQANDEQQVTTANPITLNGTCAGGAHIYLRGRVLAATNAVMTNTRFLGIKLRYSVTSKGD